MKKHFGKVAAVIIFLLMLVCGIGATFVSAATVTKTPTLQSYEMDEGAGYNYSSNNSVTSMSYGKSSMGALTVTGDINQEGTYRNTLAYGLESGSLSFSYSYDGSYQNEAKGNWYIKSDNKTSVAGISLSGSIGKGVLIIQKSYDGSTYTNAANPVVNFFGTNTSGATNFYTTSGDDISQGTYYRVVVAYTMYWKEDAFWFPDEKTKECVEVYDFYACINTGIISIHNLATDEATLPEIEGFTSEIVKKSETLLDGSTTTKGFKIDKLNASYVVQVSKDGSLIASNAADGSEFTENGKYTVKTITKLGKTISQTIYVFNGGDDKGYSTYFGSSLISGNRIFRYGDYPTYAKNSSVIINAVSDSIPNLTGTITNVTTNTVIPLTGGRERQEYVLSAGTYCADFYNSTSDAGSVYHYRFYFNVLDEKSAPYVNYYNLTHTERLEDLESKHYEVVYQTTKGGYIFVCFSLESYDEAFEYAYEIEKRFIEEKEDGLYYKSIENPSKKVKYIDYVELTSALNFYAKKNVEINYFNAIDEFTYQTYDNDFLTSLESLNISDSIKVFPSQEEKDKLLNRKPYINNFEFINVADYDVVKITAYCEKDGKTYDIEFNKPIEEQLHVSSKYVITETNVYGDYVSYEVYFVNENQTVSHWVATQNGVESVIDVSVRDVTNGKIEITADSLVLKDITNALDENAIVTIKAPSLYAFEIKCLISEMEGFTLYEKGVYELTFVDMMGNYYQFIVTINGAQWMDVLAENTTSYTALYNTVYLNAKAVNAEELAYDNAAFSNTMKDISSLSYMLYTAESLQPLVDKYNQALETSKNNPTQKEIDALNVALNELKGGLVVRENKQQLFDALTAFANLEIGEVSAEKAAKYQKTYDDALAILNNINATDDEVFGAINSISEMQEDILNPPMHWMWYVTIVIGVCAVIIGGAIVFLYVRRRKEL